jgi:protein arginine kinase
LSGFSDLPSDFQLGEWLKGSGPESDIAICTRVRFARNVQGYRFSTNMTMDEAKELNSYVGEQITACEECTDLKVVDLPGLGELERNVLMERHLISREHANAEKSRSVAVDQGESVSIMINEEDHIRAQVFRSGFQVPEAYQRAETIDEALLAQLPLAFSEEFGFLTSCPTNVGTGLRVSVMLHLPGLVWAEEMEKASLTAQKIHLAVRGLFGEGSRAIGDFYQVSNQVTLGRSEDHILSDVASAVERMVSWEREVRSALLRGESELRTIDRVHRALGTLKSAHILSSEECLTCLSALRFGAEQGILPDLNTQDLNTILLLSQPAHLQRIAKERLDAGARDLRRAKLVREILN